MQRIRPQKPGKIGAKFCWVKGSLGLKAALPMTPSVRPPPAPSSTSSFLYLRLIFPLKYSVSGFGTHPWGEGHCGRLEGSIWKLGTLDSQTGPMRPGNQVETPLAQTRSPSLEVAASFTSRKPSLIATFRPYSSPPPWPAFSFSRICYSSTIVLRVVTHPRARWHPQLQGHRINSFTTRPVSYTPYRLRHNPLAP